MKPGSYHLLVQKGEVSAQASASVQAGKETVLEPLALQLPGSVQGTATLVGATDHSGIQVYIPGSEKSAYTDAKGNFTLSGVPAGEYTVVAERAGYARASGAVQVRSGKAASLELSLAQPQTVGRVTGKATLQGASDHSGVQLFLAGTSYAAFTGPDGSYALEGVAPGTYQLTAQYAGYASASTTVTVTVGQTATAADLSLAKPQTVGSVSGKATRQGASDHTGVQVFVAGTGFSALTDRDGNYRLDGLAPGDYQLTAQYPGYAAATTAVSVTAGQTANAPVLSLAKPETVGKITGKVTSSAAPLPGVIVYLPGTQYAAISADDGSYVLEGVPPGNYTLKAERSGYVTASGPVSVTAGQATNADLDLYPLPPPMPPVIGQAPFLAARGGTLTLEGAGFGASRGLSQVSVGGVLASEYLEWGDARVTVRVPRAAGLGPQEVR
ncbi:beta-sandwich domain-containing protein, partial [Calidithermus chliarophilus]|uniref:beta-sandwich domain-containing protein n=1 Tax=Calidithermus chliarophilus TaxID=52023 RepID=UPI00055D0BE8